MNVKHLTLISSLFFAICTNSLSQVVFTKETKPAIYGNQKAAIPVETMPNLNYNKLLIETKKRDQAKKPFKFGVLHKVNFSLSNSGKWTTFENGGRVWQLKIYAPEATTINLNYAKYDLPVGGKLYVYNESRTNVLGPFTTQNEKENKEFATGLTRGAYCIVEYHEPARQKEQAVIEISGVVHGFRSVKNQISSMLKDFQDAGICNYDVGCSFGNGWEDQIKSVAMILTEDNTSGCTGTLINTTANNCEPYLLTADHCFPTDNPGDLLNNIFVFNYESPDPACPGLSISPGPVDQTIHGCTVISKSADNTPGAPEETDFCLLRLSNNPIDFYDVYYAGWDRRNIAAPGVVGIHHTEGDVKKISIEQDAVISSGDNKYWLVRWNHGTTEPGASGSSIFDVNSKRILGQLCCGDAACNGGISNNGEEDFGKIYYSWDQIGPASTQRLKPWLDPINSGVLFMDGNSCPVAPTAAFTPAAGSRLELCGPSSIRFADQSTGQANTWSWTFSGAGVSPTSSNLRDPEVSINSTGILTATLTVTNAHGTSTISQNYSIAFYSCLDNTYCASPNLDIPDQDNNGISHSITVPSSSTLVDLDIELNVSHEYIADLIITIEHNGTAVRILTKPNSPIKQCGEDNINATFDDEATVDGQLMCQTTGGNAISGNVIPYAALSAFDNMDPTGVWTINVVDDSQDDTGTLNSWCLKTKTLDTAMPKICVRPKVFLQGSWNGTNMNPTLGQMGLIPNNEPYGIDNKIAATAMNNIVDWVVIQIRDKNDNTSVIAEQTGLLRNDGAVVDVDGTSPLVFDVAPDNYYVVVKHRNHLGVMTDNAIPLN